MRHKMKCTEKQTSNFKCHRGTGDRKITSNIIN